MRSIWETSVSSFKGKHFATFPQKLINPCVKASTSEKGCCVKCGTPWERKFEKKEVEMVKDTDKKHKEIINMYPDMPDKKEFQLQLIEKGWEKQCDCDTNEVKPCIVLDPFSGMATTGLAAFKYNQHYVGIELNKEYFDMSRDRLAEGFQNVIEEVNNIKKL